MQGGLSSFFSRLRIERRHALLIPLVLVYLFLGWRPFAFELPGRISHGGEWTEADNGSPVFATTGSNPVAAGDAEWMPVMIDTTATAADEVTEFVIAVQPDNVDQHGAILAVGHGGDRQNMVVAQRQNDLVLELRTDNLRREIVAENLFDEVGFRRIILRRERGQYTIRLDDNDLITRDYSDELLGEVWDLSYDAYLGAEGSGRRSWSGGIGEAFVTIDDVRYDLLNGDGFDSSGSHWFLPALPNQFSFDSTILVDYVRNFLGFLPVGAVAMWFSRRRNLKKAVLFAAALSITIELGQFLLPGRFSILSDVVLNTLGGLVGALIARSILTRANNGETTGTEAGPDLRAPRRRQKNKDVVVTVQ